MQPRKSTRTKLAIELVLLCILSGPVLYAQTQTADKLENFHQVNEKLYRGAQPDKDGIRKLSAIGIKTIVNLREDDERAAKEADEAQAAGMRYFNIPFKRMGRPTDSQVEQVLSIIEAPENGVVFVHCHLGEDRTGTVIAIYRMVHDGWTDQNAIKEAVHYGMNFWQRGMKDYISDYYRDHVQPKPTTNEQGTS